MTDFFSNLRVRVVPWTISAAAFGYLISLGGLILISLILVSLGVLDVGSSQQDTTVTLLLSALLAILMLGVSWYFGVSKYRSSISMLGFAKPSGRYPYALALAALGLSLAFAAVYGLVVQELDIEALKPPELPEVFVGEGGNKVLAILVLAIIGPLGEEVLFRGLIFGALAKQMKVIPAIATTGALFAITHFDVAVFIPLAVTGMMLTWLYARTGSIWPPFAAHFGQNLIAVWVAFYR
ncbi:MAG: CPBP family intramembrane metalloprotease [Chloroflexi bacterium]|nr:CPBP family intramembrane metalloprotease [Chloroflexota bacterium]